MPFDSELLVSTIPGSGDRFELARDLVYRGKWETFTVPGGLVTDLASVPPFLTWLAPRYGVYTRACILHDYLCSRARAGTFSRADADGVFRRVLRELGVSLPRRWMMWGAVRLGGGLAGGIGPLDAARLVVILALMVPFVLVPSFVVAVCQLVFALAEWASRAGR